MTKNKIDPIQEAKKILKDPIENIGTSMVQEVVRKKIKLQKQKKELETEISKNNENNTKNQIAEINREILQLDKIIDSFAKNQDN